MATGLTVIRRAMRLIGVIDAEEIPTADQAETGVETLNAMIARWQRDGLGIAYVPLTSSAEALLIQSEAMDAVAYGLAMQLAPEYGVKPSTMVSLIATENYSAVLRDSVGVAHADFASMPTDGRYGFDINTR